MNVPPFFTYATINVNGLIRDIDLILRQIQEDNDVDGAVENLEAMKNELNIVVQRSTPLPQETEDAE